MKDCQHNYIAQILIYFHIDFHIDNYEEYEVDEYSGDEVGDEYSGDESGDEHSGDESGDEYSGDESGDEHWGDESGDEDGMAVLDWTSRVIFLQGL